MDAITRDDAIARFTRFLDEQLASGRQGERAVTFSIDERRRICSIKGIDAPPRPKRLPPTLGLTPQPPGR